MLRDKDGFSSRRARRVKNFATIELLITRLFLDQNLKSTHFLTQEAMGYSSVVENLRKIQKEIRN